MKLIFIAAILLGTTTSNLIAYGQAGKGRVNAGRGRRARPVKPSQTKTAVAIKSSAVTTTPSGLIYVITRRSNGRQPRPGETVVVNYADHPATSGVWARGREVKSRPARH